MIENLEEVCTRYTVKILVVRGAREDWLTDLEEAIQDEIR